MSPRSKRTPTAASCLSAGLQKMVVTAILTSTTDALFLKRTEFDNATHVACGPGSDYLFAHFFGCADKDSNPQLPFLCRKVPSGGVRPQPKRWSFLNVTETGDKKAPYAVKLGICYFDHSKPDPENPCDAELHEQECSVFETHALTDGSPTPGDPTAASACSAHSIYRTKYEVVPGDTPATLMKSLPPGTALLVQCGASPARDGPCGTQYQLQQTGRCQSWGDHAPHKYGGSVKSECVDGGKGLEVAQYFGATCSGDGLAPVNYSADVAQSCAAPPTEQYQDFNGYVGACRK